MPLISSYIRHSYTFDNFIIIRRLVIVIPCSHSQVLAEPTQRSLSWWGNAILAGWLDSFPLRTFLIFTLTHGRVENITVHMTDFPLQVISWGIFPKKYKAWFLTSRIFHESMGCKGGNMQGHTVGKVLDMGHLHVHNPPLLHPALSSRLLAFKNCTQGFPCLLAPTELTSRGSRMNGEWEERMEDSPLPGQSSAPLPKLL